MSLQDSNGLMTLPAHEKLFSGVNQLYGPNALELFSNHKVAIIGLGGVGSWVAEALIRTGFKHILLVDGDIISLSNTNRQLHAMQNCYGHSKVKVMQQRLQSISPHSCIEVIDDFLCADDLACLKNYASIIDACDAFSVKLALAKHALINKSQLQLIICGAAGGKTNPCNITTHTIIHTTHDPLLAKMRYQLRKLYKDSQLKRLKCVYSNQPMLQNKVCAEAKLACSGYGSSVMVTASMGFAAVSLLIEQLQSSILKLKEVK